MPCTVPPTGAATEDCLLTRCRTKPPGMAHELSRKRDKPLRTYGKRRTATPEPRGESPSKKMRAGGGAAPGNPTSSTSLVAEADERLEGDAPAPFRRKTEQGTNAEAKKHSILSYFKPVEHRARTVPPSAAAEAPQPDPHTTTPSPPPSRRKRKPRYLRLRATSSPLGDGAAGCRGEHEHGDEGRRSRARAEGNGPADGEAGAARSASPLRDGGGSLANQAGAGRARGEATPGAPSRMKKAPTVQTTLNISAQAAFAECKVCDTVWNPLFPDDVKYHAKRHAAVVKAKRKKEGLDGL